MAHACRCVTGSVMPLALAVQAALAPRAAEVRLGPRVGAPAPARRDRPAARRGRRRSSRPASTSRTSSPPRAHRHRTDLGRADADRQGARWSTSIATIPGARKERIVFASHYDTKLYREFRFVGASDGGSSAAFLLELARVLKARKNALHDRAAVPRRRGSAAARLGRHRQHLRQPPLRRRRASGTASLATLKALVLRRHDRRPRSRRSAATRTRRRG